MLHPCHIPVFIIIIVFAAAVAPCLLLPAWLLSERINSELPANCSRLPIASVLDICVASVLHLCSTPVLDICVASVLHPCCVRVASVLHLCCIHVVSVLHLCCICAASLLHPCCVRAASVLHLRLLAAADELPIVVELPMSQVFPSGKRCL